jgi:bifunctional non-homologous end joining protein LigD
MINLVGKRRPRMSLDEYRKKRDLTKTPEPPPKAKKSGKVLRFVVHKHSASHLHYDLRLELDGVLKSWAVPKGPSLDPSIKRLAMMVEDHPFDYRNFEGIIPKGNYGAGEVIIWDEGTYHAAHDGPGSEASLREGLQKGDLKFVLEGKKLRGEFALVKIRSGKDNSWLLLKKKDDFATGEDITLQGQSVVSHATIENLREANPSRSTEASKPAAAKPDQASPPAPAAPFPHEVHPMLATSVKEPFDDPDWIFEIKLDGYRALAELEGGKVRLYSRNNISFNKRFAHLASALEQISNDAVFDGEIVALDDKGRSYFQLLQNNQRTGLGDIYYYIFDLIYLDGKDLRAFPLLARKEMLRNLLPDLPNVRYADHIVQYGREFFDLAKKNNLEGILAKRSDSRYQTGKRGRDWLKIKIRLQQEAVICGFTEPRGSRKNFGSLVLGVYEDKDLVYIGLAGGGFDEAGLKEIHAMLDPLVQPGSPFKTRVKTDMPVKWVKPSLVCEVAFSEWTDERLMRHPIFLGIREDKDPKTVVREEFASDLQTGPTRDLSESARVSDGKESEETTKSGGRKASAHQKERIVVIDGNRLELTNLNKVFWPEEGYTKGDVIEYYRKVARCILPHLQDRPESLYRTPNGITQSGFFQKEAGELPPPWVATKEIFSRHNDKNIKYFICQDEATLVYMANLGCIEINPWLSRIPKLDFPDYTVIDLDPEDIPFEKVIETALAVHEVLERAGAASFPKTSGATGMHIYIPLGGKYDYDTAEKFAHLVATLANQQVPEFTSLIRSPHKRQKRVYLDFLQNKAGQTLAAPYSIRPRPGATVSAPLKWEEVKSGLDPREFTIKTMPSRIERLGDLFSGVLGPGLDMEECLKNLEGSSG